MSKFHVSSLSSLTGFFLLGLMLNLAVAACPQKQKKNVDCPLGITKCSQCPAGTACADCTQDQATPNDFECQNNPGKDTECVDKKNAMGVPITAACLQPYKCKDKAGGGCETDLTAPLQVKNKVLKVTKDCPPT